MLVMNEEYGLGNHLVTIPIGCEVIVIFVCSLYSMFGVEGFVCILFSFLFKLSFGLCTDLGQQWQQVQKRPWMWRELLQ
jgi:hypothetical protein